ncbi:MAG: Ralstonia phage [Pseudomonadota bacterium]|jgi:hypothetical protein
MNTQTDIVEDPELEEVAEPEEDEVTTEETEETGEEESDESESEEEAPAEDEEEEELVITLDGEALGKEDELPDGTSPRAAAKFAEMRTANRRLERESRELRARLDALESGQVAPKQLEPLGPEPKIDDDDIGFDGEKYAEKLKAYLGRKAEHDAKQRQAEEAQKAQQAEWAKRVEEYRGKAANLKKPDFEDAEAEVQKSLSVVQQGILLKHPKAEVLVYVLGKHPGRAKKLAAIADPVDFAYAVKDLEKEVAVTARKKGESLPPPSDTPVRGKVTGKSVGAASLEQLREQARRTGDYSRYHAAKAKLGK